MYRACFDVNDDGWACKCRDGPLLCLDSLYTNEDSSRLKDDVDDYINNAPNDARVEKLMEKIKDASHEERGLVLRDMIELLAPYIVSATEGIPHAIIEMVHMHLDGGTLPLSFLETVAGMKVVRGWFDEYVDFLLSSPPPQYFAAMQICIAITSANTKPTDDNGRHVVEIAINVLGSELLDAIPPFPEHHSCALIAMEVDHH